MNRFQHISVRMACTLAATVVLTAVRAANAVLGGFELNPKLSIQRVAIEPLIASPVAIAFDEYGRLFVAEMIDYPYEQQKLIGRVTLLTDTDKDGVFDTRSTYADGLSWPSGIACYDGGVFLASTPHILYLKDTDGDGKADVRNVVFSGFGSTRRAADMVVNGFVWGLDNRFHGATSVNHGLVVRGDAPNGTPALDLAGKDFSWDPKRLDIRAESGGSQFGLSFDAYGRKFVSNANFPSLVMYDHHYITRNQHHELPPVLLRVFSDRSDSEVYRISPEEQWRILRTQWRAAGKTVGPLEGGRVSGFATAAAGVTIYRGNALPSEFNGNLFLGEPSGNVVLRKILERRSVPFVVRRAPEEQDSEVLRSRELNFRPVNFANGPDGALYVVDMHRDLIEDAEAIPLEIRQQTGVNAAGGRYTGRIYRLASKESPLRTMPTLGAATPAELVAALGHPNGWMRDTASRLLYERQPRKIELQLEALAGNSPHAYARVHALGALAGSQTLSMRHLLRALSDLDAEVVEYALRLAERRLMEARALSELDAAQLSRAILECSKHDDIRVRYQAAFAIGQLPPDPGATHALHRLLTRDAADTWVTAAALNSAGDNSIALLMRIEGSPISRNESGVRLVSELLTIIGSRNRPAEIATALPLIADTTEDLRQLILVNALNRGLKRAGASLAQIDFKGSLRPVYATAARLLDDGTAGDGPRTAAILLLAQDRETSDRVFLDLLAPHESRTIQAAAIEALGIRDSGWLAKELTSRWPGFSPPVRQDALKVLLLRPERMRVILEAVRDQKVLRSDLSASQVQTLSRHPQLRELANEVFQSAKNRQEVIDRYLPALALAADAQRGRKVFQMACANCHRLGGEGFDLGPDLMGVKGHGKEGNLIAIFDPNRKVDPTYTFYEIATTTGDALTGAIAMETPAVISIKQPTGALITIPRSAIKSMTAQAQSLMPEGLEATLKLQDVADLLEYIMAAESTNPVQ